jgi:ATP/maltotriose-dependent transcriptional regulator MalT
MNTAKSRGASESRTAPFSSFTEPGDADDASVEPDRFFAPQSRWPGHWVSTPQRWSDMPEHRLLAKETLGRVARAIEALPPIQRIVVTMRDVEGCSSNEVCEFLGLTEANQRVQLHRGRSKIRRVLERHFAWLSLENDDSDPSRFWMYVIEALRTAVPSLGTRSLPLLGAPGVKLTDTVLPELVNEIDALASDLVLVLDDYHLITNAQVSAGLTFLVDHLPPSLQIAIASRSDPPLPLPRLRARRELLELRLPELRFTEEETSALLNDILGLELEPRDVARLHQRTEGWIAALCLAALSLRSRPDRADFIQAFSGDDRHLVDYLAAEVLEQEPAEVRTFLLQTSILRRLNGELCDAVTNGTGGAEMLEEIERSNLFLVPLDAKREWYRYHHLFGDLLRHELNRSTPQLVPDLNRRAAEWHRERGSVDEAIFHPSPRARSPSPLTCSPRTGTRRSIRAAWPL